MFERVQALVEELRQRLDEEKCPECMKAIARKYLTHEPLSGICKLCGQESGTGQNPAYDGLREVVREKCPGFPLVGFTKHPVKVHTSGCCDGTGYITRSWEGTLDGELTGALYRAWRKCLIDAKDSPIVVAFATLGVLLDCLKRTESDPAALAVVLEALKEVKR